MPPPPPMAMAALSEPYGEVCCITAPTVLRSSTCRESLKGALGAGARGGMGEERAIGVERVMRDDRIAWYG